MANKTILITGCFAPFHDGHKVLIQAAINDTPHDRRMIIIGVNDDAYLSNKTNWEVAQNHPLFERIDIINQYIETIDRSYLNNLDKLNIVVMPNADTYALVVALKPDVIVVGNDYTEDMVVGHEFCKKVLIVQRTQISSTEVRGG